MRSAGSSTISAARKPRPSKNSLPPSSYRQVGCSTETEGGTLFCARPLRAGRSPELRCAFMAVRTTDAPGRRRRPGAESSYGITICVFATELPPA
jgi:hypothetical protein